MLDLHAVSSGGGTVLTDIGTIALGGDGVTVAGVPLRQDAHLMAWGGITTIADTIRELRLRSLDMVDPINGEYFTPGTASLLGYILKRTMLRYVKGARIIAMRQNTAGANNLGWTLDYYNQGPVANPGRYASNQYVVRQVFGGALVAITWGEVVFAPAPPIPTGRWALLGFWANAITDAALIRFEHASFGGLRPGMLATDKSNCAVANANIPKDVLVLEEGLQFVKLSEETGQPQCPVFDVTPSGTGLNIQCIDIVADTPGVTLNLAKVG